MTDFSRASGDLSAVAYRADFPPASDVMVAPRTTPSRMVNLSAKFNHLKYEKTRLEPNTLAGFKLEKLLNQQLSNLNGVQCCTLAKVIARYDENQAAVVIDSGVLTDASNEGFVNAGSCKWGWDVDKLDA